MSTATATPTTPEARADELIEAFALLCQGNPRFSYASHMRIPGNYRTGIAANAIVTGDRVALAAAVADEDIYVLWRFRLAHPTWWIGNFSSAFPELMSSAINHFDALPAAGLVHGVITGGVGSHWYGETIAALSELTPAARVHALDALRLELSGRLHCSLPVQFLREHGIEEPDNAPDPADGPALDAALDVATRVHGDVWRQHFDVMLSHLSDWTWPALTRALEVDAAAEKDTP